LLLGATLSGCSSLQHLAVNRLGDALAQSGSTFASDDDPALVRDAAPFSLKLMESLLHEAPAHTGLLTAAAAGFTQYAYAFVQQEADEIESRDLAAADALHVRARGLYQRARDYGLRALEIRHPALRDALRRAPQSAVAVLDASDTIAAYWTAVAWASAISLDKDSPAAVAELPVVTALVMRVAALEPDFDHGALDSFLISYEMGRPDRSDARADARRHYDRALRLSAGQKAAPHVALAETVCVSSQDRREFMAQLEQALAIDTAQRPEWRLENRVMQRRARWLLARTDQLFIE
jgi:predicted anti-sigma-YlaC factor YlaD